MRVDIAVRQLEQALQRLSWDAERQISYISRSGVGADEMALEFDDAFRTASGMVSARIMPDSVGDAVQPVDDFLAEMTASSPEVWTENAVSSSQTWSDLRRVATEALRNLRKATIDVD